MRGKGDINFNSHGDLLLEKSRTPEGLLSIKDNDLFDFPEFMQAILNKNGEVQIGDTIVWYNKGIRHYISGADEAQLMKLKSNPSLGLSRDSYSVGPIGIAKGKDNPQAFSYIDYNNGYLDARHQHTFYCLDQGSSYRKFVHQVYAYNELNCDEDGCDVNSYLYVQMKLEWMSSGGWSPASDSRWVEWSLAGSDLAFISDGGTDSKSNINRSGATGTNMYAITVLIASGTGHNNAGPNSSPPFWQLTLSGYIYQWLYGDYEYNAWNNSGSPLW